MAQHEEIHCPIWSALDDFNDGQMQQIAIRRLGLDITGVLTESKRLLSLFGAMVMGVLFQPETWAKLDIRQRNNRFVDEWESFFKRWRLLTVNRDWNDLYDYGIDIINLNDHYEAFLLDLFGLIYGPEAKGDIEVFLWENEKLKSVGDPGEEQDLSKPKNFAYYFKDKYDKPDIKPSLN
jgi:hypothetical protein